MAHATHHTEGRARAHMDATMHADVVVDSDGFLLTFSSGGAAAHPWLMARGKPLSVFFWRTLPSHYGNPTLWRLPLSICKTVIAQRGAVWGRPGELIAIFFFDILISFFLSLPSRS